jgi:hypothetical protein
MPKATRAKDSNETPKTRSRKTKPADGNGTEAVEPVTTAPAIAQTTPEVIAQQVQEAPKKPNGKSASVMGQAVEPAKQAKTEPATGTAKVIAEVNLTREAVAPAKSNGHVSEEVVRRRAYELYLQRRGQGGSPEQDWFQALQEISGQHVA